MSKNNKQEAFDLFFSKLDYSTEKIEEGMVLISEPFLSDPNFTHSVVLIVKHNEEGSFGFVLNNESEYRLNEVLEDFPVFDSPVYLGGPVGVESLFFIHSRNDLISGGHEVVPGLFWGGDFEELKSRIKEGSIQQEEVIFFVGYSGWEEGQLESELEGQSWIVTGINAKEVFDKTGKSLWNKKLKQLGNEYKILSSFPADPSMN